MKILAIHRYYWPDTPPYASMLRAIVTQWVQDGHEVDVLSSQPSYKTSLGNLKQPSNEMMDGAKVMRLDLAPETGKPVIRIVNALRLGLSILWKAIVKKRYDVIMVSTSPPVLAGWFVALASRLTGARFIYHCMDIHPEIGRISGEFSRPGVYSFLSRLDCWSCAQASPVVVLSDDMADTLYDRDSVNKPNILVINNFSLPAEQEYSGILPFVWPREKFVLLFAGNIGRFQGLEVLIDAMVKLRGREDIHLLMMGEGTEKKKLMSKVRVNGARVTFLGHQSVGVAKLAMQKASMGFVSLVSGLYRFAYPSKTMTYLEQGCPVLVAVEPDSCLARDITNNGAGLAVPNGDAEKLAIAISTLADKPEKLQEMRGKAHNFAAKEFYPDVVLAKWSSVLESQPDVVNE